ncbi:MAG TPA: YetF domain-containing protein [Gaiellaceae bacterium]|nr:YetF domain-containing protein [Gaiellaceae bacterium]
MDIVFRATFAYIFIVFVLRVMGRRELSDLAPQDLVLLVVLGDLIQNGVTQSDMSVTGVTVAISTFVLMTVLSSYLAFKSKRARRVLQGEPLIIVQDGELIERNLQEERLTLDDVMEEARSNEIESLDEIKFAVVEAGGAMSFIKK